MVYMKIMRRKAFSYTSNRWIVCKAVRLFYDIGNCSVDSDSFFKGSNSPGAETSGYQYYGGALLLAI